MGISSGFLVSAKEVDDDTGTTQKITKKMDTGFIFTFGGQWDLGYIKFFVGLDFRMTMFNGEFQEYKDVRMRNYALLLNFGVGI